MNQEPNQESNPPAMENETPKVKAHQSFPCPSCGAEMNWNAHYQLLVCDYCGHEQQPQQEGQVVEYDLEEFLKSGASKAQGYGLETKSIQCRQCGATTAVEPHVTSVECPFCGSSAVLEQETDADVIRPESVVPFKISRDFALRNYRTWLGRGIFRPGDLARRAARGQIYGVYIPFWTFDAEAFSRWWADAGYYYYETETYTTTENGDRVTKTREVRKTRWEPEQGRHKGHYDDVLVYATNSLDQEILERIYPYNTKELAPYAPEYLSGWRAEQYQINLQEGWQIGQEKIEDYERDACVELIPGDTYRNLNVETAIADVTFKHALLPVWIASYRYNDKVYRYMVNGQTGKVQGEKPISWIRVAIAVIIVLVIIGVIIYLMSRGENAGAQALLALWGMV
jgi:predicted RNA-binding Zn-ribbon protein involved in translation (DUF1610 family)